ncbi:MULTISPECIES: hypothetical protein [unclassified Agromyces]|uniref:hypothetical protein n=1 Tax=unclassified Agromyces TaxID=2639701 RepID=UPI0030146625
MDEPRAGSAGERRGRHAAPPSGPAGLLDRAASAALAALGRVRERGRAAIGAFRAGPLVPWVSAHRGIVLIGGSLVVSAAALASTAAMIASPGPPPAAEGTETVDDGARPRPGSDFTMPTPAPTTTTPTPEPTPIPTATPVPAEPGTSEPPSGSEPTPAPVEPTPEPEEDAPGNSGNSPGAANRPDKTKG